MPVPCALSRAYFNPLFPYGKRLRSDGTTTTGYLFQSTLPIREETGLAENSEWAQNISIHSSHTGRDIQHYYFKTIIPISIHSSHTGRDGIPMVRMQQTRFQSTLPIREETVDVTLSHLGQGISIHSSHTGRDCCLLMLAVLLKYFNPLFPYGKRQHSGRGFPPPLEFQSTLPIREETTLSAQTLNNYTISIHSSHTGRDHLCRRHRQHKE